MLKLRHIGLLKIALVACIVPGPAAARSVCSNQYLAMAAFLGQNVPYDNIARQIWEIRKSKVDSELVACLAAEKSAQEEERWLQAEQRENVAQQAALEAEQIRQQSDATARLRADTELTSAISQAILAGRCEDAKVVALTNNRLDLAEQAMHLCKPVQMSTSRSKPTIKSDKMANPPKR